MPRENGLQTADGPYILALVVSSGYQRCGLVDWPNVQIFPTKASDGNQIIAICLNSMVLHSWKGMLSLHSLSSSFPYYWFWSHLYHLSANGHTDKLFQKGRNYKVLSVLYHHRCSMLPALVLHIIQLNGMILPLGGECHKISQDWEILIPNSSIL